MNSIEKTVLTSSVLALLLLTTGCHEKLTRYSRKRNTTSSYGLLNDSTLFITGISADPDFGYTPSKPIMVGMVDVHKAAKNVEKYINALRGANGEAITYKRLKACCPFKTKNFTFIVPILGTEFDGKHGMLEQYRVEYNDGSTLKSTILYINLYDETKVLLAPKGFTYRDQ